LNSATGGQSTALKWIDRILFCSTIELRAPRPQLGVWTTPATQPPAPQPLLLVMQQDPDPRPARTISSEAQVRRGLGLQGQPRRLRVHPRLPTTTCARDSALPSDLACPAPSCPDRCSIRCAGPQD